MLNNVYVLLTLLVPTINNLIYVTAENTEIRIAGLYSGEGGDWEGEELPITPRHMDYSLMVFDGLVDKHKR